MFRPYQRISWGGQSQHNNGNETTLRAHQRAQGRIYFYVMDAGNLSPLCRTSQGQHNHQTQANQQPIAQEVAHGLVAAA